MIAIVRNRTTGSTDTFHNVNRIESKSKDDGSAAIIIISLTDGSTHYYPTRLYSYEAVDGVKRGRSVSKSEEWKKLRESILGSTEGILNE